MPISTTYQPNAPAARSGQGSALSNREDLESGFYRLEAGETPIFSLCSKGRSTSTFHEWNLDKLAAPTTDGVPEGQDVQAFADKFADAARVGNYTQKKWRPWSVSDTQEAVTSAGPVNKAEAKVKAMLELKRDFETVISSDNDMQSAAGGGTPYLSRGLGSWISNTAQTTNPVPADYRTPSASILTSAPTETSFSTMLSSIFTQTGEMGAFTLVAGTALRSSISNFQRTDNNTSESVYHVTESATSKTCTLSVTLLDTDFGVVKVLNANAQCFAVAANANRGYLLNPKYLGFHSLIGFESKELEDQGGGPRGYVKMTGTLKVGTPLAFGKIAHA